MRKKFPSPYGPIDEHIPSEVYSDYQLRYPSPYSPSSTFPLSQPSIGTAGSSTATTTSKGEAGAATYDGMLTPAAHCAYSISLHGTIAQQATNRVVSLNYGSLYYLETDNEARESKTGGDTSTSGTVDEEAKKYSSGSSARLPSSTRRQTTEEDSVDEISTPWQFIKCIAEELSHQWNNPNDRPSETNDIKKPNAFPQPRDEEEDEDLKQWTSELGKDKGRSVPKDPTTRSGRQSVNSFFRQRRKVSKERESANTANFSTPTPNNSLSSSGKASVSSTGGSSEGETTNSTFSSASQSVKEASAGVFSFLSSKTSQYSAYFMGSGSDSDEKTS